MANKLIKCFAMGGFALSLNMLEVSYANGQAHVHGAGDLLIAQEDSQWQFQFRLPAADLLGFEHAPETQAQKDRLTLVGEQISDLSKVVVLPSFCKLTESDNSLNNLASAVSGVHPHGDHEHDDHKHEGHSHGDHKHDSEHAHDDHTGHSDITLTYVFECKNILKQAQVTIFSIAPSLNTIQAQWITNKGQGAQNINESAAILRF
jgi:hypothetical protein